MRNEENIDLIVLGTHGRTGLAHVALGSVAEKVLRAAVSPVMVVRHKLRKFPPLNKESYLK